MNKEILYTTATDKNGGLIRINNAEKGVDYYCPLCKKEFILRKSGKTGKGSRRSHFAHNEITPNCTPEGVLHYSFKKMLIELLERHKTENKPFILNWFCNSCGCKNSGNLLEKTASIKEEYGLGECRPDIALIDKAEKIIAVIEVVVTHEPEESVLQYYKENKITLIRIDLTSEQDLNRIEEKVKNPDIVDLCLSPKCSNRDQYRINRRVAVLQTQCNRCSSPIEKYEIAIESVLGKRMSLDFTDDEINWMKSKANEIGFRVQIAEKEDTKEKYPVFVCENCQRMRNRYRSSRL